VFIPPPPPHLFSGRNVKQTRESGGNQAYFWGHCDLNEVFSYKKEKFVGNVSVLGISEKRTVVKGG